MSKSYNYRKDYRTDDEFKEQISKTTEKEKFLIQVFIREMKHRGRAVDVFHNGIDNSGKVFKGKSSARADYIAHIDDKEIKLEVKNSYVADKCTFKVYNLKYYASNNTNILLFYNTDNINRDISRFNFQKAKWGIITPEAIKKILEDKKEEMYEEYKFGNKLCVRIFENEYSKYFKIESITYAK